MTTYAVYVGNTLIGHSDLETGDPPMGVASGKFLPTPQYASLRSACIAAFANRSQEHLGLKVLTPEGAVLPAQGGVMLIDGEGVPIGEIEIEVAGIPYPLYSKLFPGHLSRYDQLAE